jgi:hypothetical protein
MPAHRSAAGARPGRAAVCGHRHARAAQNRRTPSIDAVQLRIISIMLNHNTLKSINQPPAFLVSKNCGRCA